MRAAFRAHGKPLPPWREPRALLSKWIPEWWEDQEVPLVALPQQAAAAAAAAQGRWSDDGAPALTSWRPGRLQQPVPGAFGRGGGGAGGGAPAQATSSFALAGGAAGSAASEPEAQLPSLPPAPRSKSDSCKAMPDVPRKIIVGFPARDQQQEHAQPGGGSDAAGGGRLGGDAGGERGAGGRPGHIAAWANGLQRPAAAPGATGSPGAGPAANTSASGQLQRSRFKPLDSLLPPVRVVKLGAA
jgi:hypothetical protein